jgi:hypothetical protein
MTLKFSRPQPSTNDSQLVIDRVSFAGLPNCYRLANGTVEAIVSTDIGPRILRYGFIDAENLLAEVPHLATPTSLGRWKPWGGHRLWVAPEHMPESYAPDNGPIRFELLGDSAIQLDQPLDAAGYEKRMTLELAPEGSNVTVHHRVTNHRGSTVEIAPWGITAVNGPGETLVPQEPFQSHDDYLLPIRAFVLWSFTDLTDPRIILGRNFLRLRTDAARPEPQKFGVSNRQGWCAFHQENSRNLFVKRHTWETEAVYPDKGANFETYTAGTYLELETLGPLRPLAPGESADHTETWQLFPDIDLGPTDDTAQSAIQNAFTQSHAPSSPERFEDRLLPFKVSNIRV